MEHSPNIPKGIIFVFRVLFSAVQFCGGYVVVRRLDRGTANRRRTITPISCSLVGARGGSSLCPSRVRLKVCARIQKHNAIMNRIPRHAPPIGINRQPNKGWPRTASKTDPLTMKPVDKLYLLQTQTKYGGRCEPSRLINGILCLRSFSH